MTLKTKIPTVLAAAGLMTTVFAGAATTADAAAKPTYVECGAAHKVTKKMCAVFKAADKASRAGGYHWDRTGRCKSADRLNWHPSGRACDLIYGKLGSPAKQGNLKDGNKLVKWLVAHHSKYSLHHVIWQSRIYSGGNWKARPYPCKGVTDCHKDHVHVATVS
ncbi:hypothetical protein NE236_14590 [Actinoallomurus purpureus]|uniref:hypothetical protein n=1 Tax=Actinoallomurus purpureus TaxID=478114 RepID=UPI0020935C07|nr:hypothetical protein [Actinoallomurus purpureus]MCO6006218.1 hypothetical protein [Actinoallomurus purpureus]